MWLGPRRWLACLLLLVLAGCGGGRKREPAQTGATTLTGSEHASGPASRGGATVALTADWCSSPPRFVGRDQLWVTCQDNGFLTLRFTKRGR